MAKRYGERWEVVESLGEGGQAHAFRVKDLQDPNGDEGWVLKRLKNTNRLGRFETEIEALKKIESARIPRVTDYSIGNPAYLVYPYIGPTLDRVVDDLSFDQAWDLFEDVVQAVMDAHWEDIAHRDIKPQNILVDENPEHRRAYLIDFGICQIENGQIHTLTDEALGSRDFAAPELEVGAPGAPGRKSDIYSLGKLLYWMVTRGGYFARENFEQRLDAVPNDQGVERSYVRNLLSRTVVVTPDERTDATSLRTDVGIAGRLIRQGVNLVGARDQTCPICRQGTLKRRAGPGDIRNVGFNPTGDPSTYFRLLHCGHCGYMQVHDIRGTTGEDLWEI